MKRFLAICLLVGIALIPTVAGATVYTMSEPTIVNDPDTFCPSVTFNLPATFAQNDSAYGYIYLPAYWSAFEAGTDPAEMHIGWYSDFGAGATDSISVRIGVGVSKTQTFTNTFSASEQSCTITKATPFVVKVSNALTALAPLPYLRVALKCKGATSISGKTFTVVFPRRMPNKR